MVNFEDMWIPIKPGCDLPKNYQSVLVTFYDEEMYEPEVREMSFIYGDFMNDTMYASIEENPDCFYDDKGTHYTKALAWMPKPKPYKEKKHE